MPEAYEGLGLAAVGFDRAIPETGETLTENARIKAEAVHAFCGLPCFADDSGLEVDALRGAPGVYSARYAGEGATAAHNVKKLLDCMQGQALRTARFRTVIYYKGLGEHHSFEGVLEGEILREERGAAGFGYDSIFRPEGYAQSFAQMSLEQKNAISHRARAFQQFVDFLRDARRS